jgi:hypothetical protein
MGLVELDLDQEFEMDYLGSANFDFVIVANLDC